MTRVKKAKAGLGSQPARMIRPRLGPRGATRPQRERPPAEVVLKILNRALQVEALPDRRNLRFTAAVLEFFVPGDGRGLAGEAGCPPRSGSGVQVGLHMSPAVALDFHDAGVKGRLHASLCGAVVLFDAVAICELLLPRRKDPSGFAVRVTGVDVRNEHRLVLRKRRDEAPPDDVLAQRRSE